MIDSTTEKEQVELLMLADAKLYSKQLYKRLTRINREILRLNAFRDEIYRKINRNRKLIKKLEV